MKLLLTTFLCLVCTSQVLLSQIVKRDTKNTKDVANVFYKPEFTLFDLWSDEPISPAAGEIYSIYYATNENKTPQSFSGTAIEISKLYVYKFKNYDNCKSWCAGIAYKNTSNSQNPTTSSATNSKNSESSNQLDWDDSIKQNWTDQFSSVLIDNGFDSKLAKSLTRCAFEKIASAMSYSQFLNLDPNHVYEEFVKWSDICLNESKSSKSSNIEANLYYKKNDNLYDLWSGELIKPDAEGVYHIHIVKNECGKCEAKDLTSAQLDWYSNVDPNNQKLFKFKTYRNCMNWCDGIDYNSTLQQKGVSSSIGSVDIGSQTWMNKNLEVEAFRNGEIIPQAETEQDWKYYCSNRLPAWRYAKIGSATSQHNAVKLYNYYAISDGRGLLPIGWHLPSQDEWSILIKFVGENGGKKLKSQQGWDEWTEGGKKTVTCGNCADWNESYRSKVPCHVCKDTRNVIQETPIIKYSGKGENSFGFNAIPNDSFSGFLWAESNQYAEWWTSSLRSDKSPIIVQVSQKSNTIEFPFLKGMMKDSGLTYDSFGVRGVKDK